jgi:hypothetical protein
VIRRLGEAIAIGALGAGLAGLAGGLVGMGLAAAAVGGVNGVVSGWLGVYGLRRARGWVALILDSTWGLLGVASGLVLHLVNLFWPGSGYEGELSQRQDRHVYSRGASPRGGFALSLGNVVSNAGGKVGLRGESAAAARRRRFVTAHEELHIWQNRWFGPVFPVIYGAWLVGGAIFATLAWPVVRGSWWNAVETVSYYDNPFEYWAYRNDGYWPPRGIHPKLAWRKRGI